MRDIHPSAPRRKKNRQEAADVRRALVDIPQVLGALGLDDGARREGPNYKIRCPWHADNRPSCSVTIGADSTIQAKCFACGEGGDVLSMIAAVHRLDARRDFVRVMEVAAQIAGCAPLDAPRRPVPPAPRTAAPVLPDDDFDRLAVALLDLCPLDGQPDVRAYVEGRGLYEAVKCRWGALPAGFAAQRRVIEQLVAAVGLEVWTDSALMKEEDPSRFVWSDHRLVIPWRTSGVDGVITTLQRRVIKMSPQYVDRKYIFPAGRKPVEPYNIEDAVELLGDGVQVAYVEGAVDAHALNILAERQGRDLVAVGLPGVSVWRPEWARLAQGRVAAVALDADRAGEEQVHQIGHDLLQAGATKVLRLRPSGAGDWCDELRASR